MISGTKKMLVFDDTLPDNKITLFDRGVEGKRMADLHEPPFTYRDGASRVLAYDRTEPMATLINDFFGAIAEDRQPLTNGAQGLRIVKLLEAVEESIKKQGVRVKPT